MQTDVPSLAWVLALPEGATLLHIPSGVVGHLGGVFGPGEYVDPEGHTLDAPVLRLDTGDTFVALSDHFAVLGQGEHDFFQRASTELRKVVGTAIGIARILSETSSLTLPRALLLIRSALAVQLRELSRSA